MNLFAKGLCGVVLAGSATMTLAETSSSTLYQYKNWEVEFVTYDDGTVACLAEVDDTTDSFTVWVHPDASVSLQFYSTAWDFGDTGETANLGVQIDRRAGWTLNDAELYLNSVLFNLPDDNSAVEFLGEVAAGTRLYLRAENGDDVINYSLSGSRASMNALIECANTITADGNPFQ